MQLLPAFHEVASRVCCIGHLCICDKIMSVSALAVSLQNLAQLALSISAAMAVPHWLNTGLLVASHCAQLMRKSQQKLPMPHLLLIC